jgi:hypothetical protein
MLGLLFVAMRLMMALAVVGIATALATAGGVIGLPLLIATALAGVAGAIGVQLVRPGLAAALACSIGGPLLLYALVAGMLGWGVLVEGEREEALRTAAVRSRAIELVDDRSGLAFGILPASLTRLDQPQPGYSALHLGPEEIPPAWEVCLRWYEDRHLDSPWHIAAVDLWGLLRAYYMKFLGRREGASTLGEMVGRELRAEHPNTKRALHEELPRKLASWRDGPALTSLFPGDSVVEAAAVHLPLVIGLRGSSFGAEVHGLGLAAQTVFGHRLDTVAPSQAAAEAALFAAAVNRPLALARADDPGGQAKARRRFDWLKARADNCLQHAPFPDGFDRAAARDRLAALSLPSLAPSSATAAKTGSAANAPEREAVHRLGAAITGIPPELRRIVGDDWRERVARAHVNGTVAPPALVAAFAAAVRRIGQQHVATLAVPLWEGEDRPAVAAVVADGQGRLLVEITNADGGIAAIGAQPIASLGKIAAALVLGRTDAPHARYCLDQAGCASSLGATEAFAYSHSPAILRRLTRHSEAEAQAAFAALGWPAPPAGAARYDAAYGTVEVRPAQVLRAAIAITNTLAERGQPAPLPHLVTRVELRDGTRLDPADEALDPAPLATAMTPPVRRFVEAVLRAPYEGGTLHNVGWLRSQPGIEHLWGKTGTGDGGDGRTRVLWQVGGFVYRGRAMSFLVLIAGSNRAPLGRIQARAVSPLTTIIVRHALRDAEE